MTAVVDQWLAVLGQTATSRTVELYSSVLRRLVQEVGPPEDWSVFSLMGWLETLGRRGCGESTKHTYLLVIRSFCRQHRPDLVDRHADLALPSRIKFMPQRPRVATVEEVEQLLASDRLTHRQKLGLALMSDAGLREIEVRSLTWADVNLEAWTLRVQGKGRKVRQLPVFTETLRGLLFASAPPPPRDGFHVVPGRGGGQMARGVLSRQLGDLSEEVVGHRLPAHAYRHSFAVRASQSRVNTKCIQMALGHQALATTDRYLRSLEGDVESLREGFGGFR